MCVEVGTGVPDGDWIRVESDELCPTVMPLGTSGHVGQVVSSPTPDVQNFEPIVPPKERRQYGVGRGVRPEKLVCEAKVSQRSSQAHIRDRKVVHPLLGLQTGREIRKWGLRGRHGSSTREIGGKAGAITRAIG